MQFRDEEFFRAVICDILKNRNSSAGAQTPFDPGVIKWGEHDAGKQKKKEYG